MGHDHPNPGDLTQRLTMAPGRGCCAAKAAGTMRWWVVVLAAAVSVQTVVGETGYSALNEDALASEGRPNVLQVEAAEASHKWHEANDALKAATAGGTSQAELSKLARRVQVMQKRAKQAELRAFHTPSGRRLGDAPDSGDKQEEGKSDAKKTDDKADAQKEEDAGDEKEQPAEQAGREDERTVFFPQ